MRNHHECTNPDIALINFDENGKMFQTKFQDM